MYQTFAEEEEISKLQRYVQEIDKLCFKKGGEKFSYLQCTYRELLGDNADIREIAALKEYLRRNVNN